MPLDQSLSSLLSFVQRFAELFRIQVVLLRDREEEPTASCLGPSDGSMLWLLAKLFSKAAEFSADAGAEKIRIAEEMPRRIYERQSS